jgi:hypothetical protein
MAGTIVADNIQAAATSTLVLKNGVANTPPTIQDSGGVEIGTFCRAWVNFNGTGTVAIRASFNVSSITDNGTGNYTVNFTIAMPDVNYSTTATCAENVGVSVLITRIGTVAAGSVQVFSVNRSDGGLADTATYCVSIFR